MNNKQLNPYEKMETISQVRDQVRDIVSELHGDAKEEKPPQSRLDFLADQNGNTLKVDTNKSNEVVKRNDIVNNEDLAKMKQALPDRTKEID